MNFKKILCLFKHNYEHIVNRSQEDVNAPGGSRHIWSGSECTRCKKRTIKIGKYIDETMFTQHGLDQMRAWKAHKELSKPAPVMTPEEELLMNMVKTLINRGSGEQE